MTLQSLQRFTLMASLMFSLIDSSPLLAMNNSSTPKVNSSSIHSSSSALQSALIILLICLVVIFLVLLAVTAYCFFYKTNSKPKHQQSSSQISSGLLKSHSNESLYHDSVDFYNNIMQSGQVVKSFSKYFVNNKKECDVLMHKRAFKSYNK